MESIKEILEKIQALWNTNLEIFQMLKTWKTKYEEIINFIDKFFTIVPYEIIFLFFFVALFMVLLNNISPTTPRINLTVGVVIFSVMYLYIINIFTNQWKILRILYVDSFILVPAYLVEISRLIKKTWYKIKFKELSANSSYFQASLAEVHKAYADLLISEINFSKNPENFVTSLSNLETKIQTLKVGIKKIISKSSKEST